MSPEACKKMARAASARIAQDIESGLVKEEPEDVAGLVEEDPQDVD